MIFNGMVQDVFETTEERNEGWAAAIEDITGEEPTPEPEPEKTLVSIAITTQPTKTAYVVNDKLDLSGLVVTATYSDGTTAEITEYTSNPEEGTTLTGSLTVTITYEGKTAEFDVSVNR